MNCRRAQTEIALWAGNDLDETDRQCLQRHLEACPPCRDYQAQMQALMRLVDDCPLREEADEASKSAVADSLWPSLSSRLVSLPAPQADRFNGWIPAVAVSAVCLAMLIVAGPFDVFRPRSEAGTPETVWSPAADAPNRSLDSAREERSPRPPITSMLVDERSSEAPLFDFSEQSQRPQGLPPADFQDFPFPAGREAPRFLDGPPMVIFFFP